MTRRNSKPAYEIFVRNGETRRLYTTVGDSNGARFLADLLHASGKFQEVDVPGIAWFWRKG